MTLVQVVQSFFITLVVSCILGVMIRCYQENYHPYVWLIALWKFTCYVSIDLILPFLLFRRVLKRKKYSKSTRVIIALLAIPLGYIVEIGNFEELSDEFLWSKIAQIDKKVRNKKVRYRVIPSKTNTLELYMDRMIIKVNDKFSLR